ncbi:DUF2225 domain-containing protein [Paenibacillus thermoaerophilus]|nr:DUF2225 domain-containing protein [Paenibacillus thermoaerophilus]
MPPLYPAKTVCRYCERTYRTMRVRPSHKKSTEADSDFCMRFTGVNPDYYVVRVCPYCGYSMTDHFSKKPLTERQRVMFEEKIGRSWNKLDLTGERTINEAMFAYKLALVCAQASDETDRVLAGILHHIAWLYRLMEDEANEKRFLAHALDAYMRVFEYEGLDYNNAKLMYLIGELNRRLGQYNEAVRWFSRVVNDNRIVDAAMIRKSREQWQLVREEMQRLKLQPELPGDEIKGA